MTALAAFAILAVLTQKIIEHILNALTIHYGDRIANHV